MKHKQYKMAILAFDGISAFHLSVPCLVFQDMFIEDYQPFDVSICSISSKPLKNSSGFTLQTKEQLEALSCADIVIVPSWPSDVPSAPAHLLKALVEAHRRGALLVGLCLGAFVLAETGLLNGQAATTHWAYSQAFKSRFPEVLFDSEPLFIEHEQIVTSAGIAAALDCCLHLLRRFVGNEVAADLARKMVTAPFRSGGQQQYIPLPIPDKPLGETSFSKVMELVEQQLNLPIKIDEVAARCAMSRRTFTRHFKAIYGCTFGEWLLNQRLKLSQTLLETSSTSIALVAEQSGFGSQSVYRKHFKQAFSVSPTQWRKTFSG
ncbi:GlxA family transcriptional regulator [Shewanella sp. 10N.286.45.A1]|uniref:GlxA family transcriptional regulator n=1 Tax=Shewanella sp. 10N.286.45.A1 TaxID=3229694 RepID=UPI003553D489